MKITIGHLYPELLNLYGDRGNITAMRQRLKWRGIEAEVVEYRLGDKIDFKGTDIILLGGGSDREQRIVCQRLREIKGAFKDYVEEGGVTLAVCGGYQLLGKYYSACGGLIEGLHLLDLYTEQGEGRLIGNIVLKSEAFSSPIAGFENHGGRTFLNGGRPFGKVLFGFGNDEESGFEGVMYKNVVGTYLHGPLLPKNPEVCDYLLLCALKKRYGTKELRPLDDGQEKRANQYIVDRFVKPGRG